ncbi:hypothetical protein GCM10017600_13790 [Streptosporangium carneum]|uniref:Uncharacterized protein n=1 Tax=Streptosporangium carneum TaxID=47481 RepID=A0A9W6MB56_9ACTN|nr:hypothetical protein GCM10017600_13790 [Streptosporangium carneum]
MGFLKCQNAEESLVGGGKPESETVRGSRTPDGAGGREGWRGLRAGPERFLGESLNLPVV